MGWKAITGCAILNEAWLIRLEQMVTLEDTTDKHYYDNTTLTRDTIPTPSGVTV